MGFEFFLETLTSIVVDISLKKYTKAVQSTMLKDNFEDYINRQKDYINNCKSSDEIDIDNLSICLKQSYAELVLASG